jgi:nitroimidazol reductase NimA-like FMN-containing flavoprotein (pyridoxamine 5'-phosphate oxidase superfamily)
VTDIVGKFPPEKRWAYLARAKTMRVATTNADGSIYLSPVWFIAHEKALYVAVDASRHGENFLAARPFAALVDEGSEEYRSVSGLRIFGTTRMVNDPALFETLQHLMFEKYFYVGHPHAQAYFEFGEFARRRYFELVPSKMIGWDSRETTQPQGREAHRLPAHVGDRHVTRPG